MPKSSCLTNTPVIQRLLGCLTITVVQKAAILAKSTKPRHRITLQRGSFMLKNGKSLDFKRFSGVEKVHRNFDRITVDLWRRGWDSNPCAIARKLISSLLCNCDGDVRFRAVSVSPVPAESRLKSGFFAQKALRDGLF